MTYLAQRDRQQKLEWIDGSTYSILLDGEATGGQLMVGRLETFKGEASPIHMHTREDEIFLMIEGTALLWSGDQEMELGDGGIVYLPRNVPHGYRVTSERADLLMIATPSGIEGMFRHAGRDLATPRPEGFTLLESLLAEASDIYGSVIVGPAR